MLSGSAEEQIVENFASAQRTGIGAFTVEASSGRWWWADAIYEVFALTRRSEALTWTYIRTHIPEAERPEIEAAYEQARTNLGTFSWSHRVHAADRRVRSVLVVGETSALVSAPSQPTAGPVTARLGPGAAGESLRPGTLVLQGYLVDLTDLHTRAARAAATAAVEASAAHRAVIEQAKGALMLGYSLDADAAFALLARQSQHSNRKLHAVAADLLRCLASSPSLTRNPRDRLQALEQLLPPAAVSN